MRTMLKRVKEQLLPKFTKQTSKEENVLNISLNDCTCPICLEILIEPVKMPCKHEICLNCFDTMLDKTNLCCPMCRLRISTWSRNARLTNSLVDLERWKQIQKSFPNEIKNRLEGKTQQNLLDSLSSMMPAMKKPKCAEQGEIRQEYLDFIRREEERIRIEKENEEKMSLAYIEQVLRQEGGISVNEYLETQRQLGFNSQQVTQNRQNIQQPQYIVQQRVISQVQQQQQIPLTQPQQQVLPIQRQHEQHQLAQPILNPNPNIINIINQEVSTAILNTPEQPITTESNRKRQVRRTYSTNNEFTRVTRSSTMRQATKPTNLETTSTPILATTSSTSNQTKNNNLPTTSKASRGRKTNDSTLDTLISSANTSQNTTSSILEVSNSTPKKRKSSKQTQNSRSKRI